MNAKRWSPLGVFLAGCLSGAAFIGLHSATQGASLPSSPADGSSASEFETPFASRDVAREQSSGQEREPPGTSHSESGGERVAVVVPEETGDEIAPAGQSLADVLARLEAEYRERLTPDAEPFASAESTRSGPPSESVDARPEPHLTATTDPSAVDESTQPSALVQARSASPELHGSGVSPVAPKAPEAVADVEPTRPEPVLTSSDSARNAQLRVSNELQQLAAFQQVTLAQQMVTAQQVAVLQQFALLHYLQHLQPPPAFTPKVPAGSRPPRVGISVAFPGSLSSDTWKPFEFSPTVLVR